MSTAVVLASYFGPEEKAPGVRVARLAMSARRLDYHVSLVCAANEDRDYTWNDGVAIKTFRRRDPSDWRDRRRGSLAQAANTSETTRVVPRPIRRLARAFLQPDEYILSARAFLRRAREECVRLQARFDRVVAIVSSPPWSTALVGLLLHRAGNASVCFDLQDLWSENPAARWPPFGRLVARFLEKRAMYAADGFLFVNEQVAQHYRSRWSVLGNKPCAVAPIGIEGEVPADLVVRPRGVMRIGYFGTLYQDRSFETLLTVCRLLEGSTPRPIIEWYGGILDDHPSLDAIRDAVSRRVLFLHDPLSHQEALERMRECDLLLTVPSPQYREELTTKLYDYLSVGRPVIALTPRGSYLQTFLEASNTGVSFPPEDINGIRAFVERCLADRLTFHPRADVIAPHRTSAIDDALQHLLKGLTPAPNS